MKKSRKIFIAFGFFIAILMIVNSYYYSKKDYNSNYSLMVLKIDTTSTGTFKINDTFKSPNFMISSGHKLQLNDYILKPARSKYLFIKRKIDEKYIVIYTIKKTGLFNN